MHRLRWLIGAALLIGCSSSMAVDYYRWTDSKGMTHYSDKPPQGIKAERVKTGKAVSNPTDETATPQPDAKTSERCKEERDRLTLLSSHRQIQMKMDDGSMRTLNAEEVQQERAFTEKAVALYCE